MKLPKSSDYTDIVNRLIENLGLGKAADTKIGGTLVKGVSGGERKRTSIGVELITDPSLIFLDEPTTGLDSFTAFQVVEVLNSLSMSGRTVICTIHQPNSETFALFDQLMLLMHGRVIYMNQASKALGYFSKIGFQCPERTNPADFFMDTMSIEKYEYDGEDPEELNKRKSQIEDDYNQKLKFLIDQYENSEFKCKWDDVDPNIQVLDKTDKSQYRVGIFTQFFILQLRAFKNIFRLPISSYVKVISAFILSIMVILIYGRLGNDRPGIQSRNGVLFFSCLTFMMNSINSVLLIFPDEKPVFTREQHNEMYSPTIYFITKVVSMIPHTSAFFKPCLVLHNQNLTPNLCLIDQ